MRKFMVFLPQMIAAVVSMSAGTGAAALSQTGHGLLTVPTGITAVVAGAVAVVTTFIKMFNISDDGWGQYIDDECRNCASLQRKLSASEAERAELQQALVTLRLP